MGARVSVTITPIDYVRSVVKRRSAGRAEHLIENDLRIFDEVYARSISIAIETILRADRKARKSAR